MLSMNMHKDEDDKQSLINPQIGNSKQEKTGDTHNIDV